jgi:SNF2 family DNA or RNA helicase
MVLSMEDHHMYVHKVKPFAHQEEALNLSWDKEAFALLMEMGTGKTKVAIDTIGKLFLDKQITAAVIIAPKGVYMNWVNKELPQHLTPELVGRTIVVPWKGGRSVSQRDALSRVLDWKQGLSILVVNVEAFSTGDKAIDMVESFLRKHRCILVLDESTTIKNHKSKRAKALLYLSKFAAYRRILTGMPVTRSPLDIFAQFEFLRAGLLGFGSFWTFKSRYAIEEDRYFGERRVKVITGYQNEADLQKRITPYSYRVLKEDCLDLPPKLYQARSVELTPEQRRVYDDILENATSQLNEKDHVTATEVITQLLRLHQVVCGHVLDENRVVHDLPENRTKALVEVLSETDSQAIIWCSYRHDVQKVIKAISELGKSVQYHGGVDTEERAQAILDFQEGRARFFVGTPHTGGHGITLTNASVVIYYSNTHNLELRAQSEDRAHRIGQKANAVTYVDLVSEGTVDEKILKSLRNKINIASAIVGDGYREWLI